MIRRLLFKLLGILVYLICACFLAVQLAYWLSFHYDFDAMMNASRICWDYRIVWWQGNDDYFHLALILILLGLVVMIMWLFLPNGKKDKNANSKDDAKKEKLPDEEEEKYSHRQTKHEAKKTLQRLQFNEWGNLNHIYYNRPDYKKYKEWWIGTASWIIQSVLTILFLILSFNTLIQWIGTLINKDFIFGMPNLYGKYGTSFLLYIGVIGGLMLLHYVLAMPVCDLEAYKAQGNPVTWRIFIPHIRDYADWIFDPEKTIINKIREKLQLPANNNLNTLKYKTVDGKVTCRRAGLSVITKKRMCWVVHDDDHSTIVGTTNSGKTYGTIEGMIDNCIMAGTSIVVNDIKGELYTHHAAMLKKHGYNVVVMNWVNPEKSDCWNPLGIVIKSYRTAENRFLREMEKDPEKFNEWGNLKKSAYVYVSQATELFARADKIRAMASSPEENKKAGALIMKANSLLDQADDMHSQMEIIEDIKADYSEAWELLNDITRILCEEKDAKQVFFWQQSQILMEGLVAFLLEYEYMGSDGTFHHLEDNQINFSNVNRLYKEGCRQRKIGGKTQLILNYWVQNFFLTKSKTKNKLGEMLDQQADSLKDIKSTFENKLQLATMNDKIARMMSCNTFDFVDIVRKKTAVFICAHDEKPTYYPFITIFMSQMYSELIAESRNYPKDRLPISVDVIYDEFGISPAISKVENMLNASRSRGIRWHLVVQDYSQIVGNYGKENAQAIKGATKNKIFLLSDSKETIKEFSEGAGKEKLWNKNKNQWEVRQVVTEDELIHLSLGQAIIERQRQNVYKTTMLGYGSFIYYKEAQKDKTAIRESKPLPRFNVFSITSATTEMQKIGEITLDSLKQNKEEDFEEEKATQERINERKKRLKERINRRPVKKEESGETEEMIQNPTAKPVKSSGGETPPQQNEGTGNRSIEAIKNFNQRGEGGRREEIQKRLHARKEQQIDLKGVELRQEDGTRSSFGRTK